MLGRVVPVKSIRNALSYNEQKLIEGRAECILAENFIKDLRELSREDKLHHFMQRISLNERVEYNTIHNSVNFGAEEKISIEQMKELAKRYMEGLGFGEQPYLAYRHTDSAHDHFHIVSTYIQADGSKIDIDKALLYRSHALCRKLEQEYSLQPRHRAGREEEEKFKVDHAERVVYGEKPLQRAINDVLHTVVEHYKYTNLAELNAVLQVYGVKADRGRESSRVYQNRGLLYHAVDEEGKQVGKSIKASDFLLKPTLDMLEGKFALYSSQREEWQQRMTTAIDWTLAGQAPDWQGFKDNLESEGINVVVQTDKEGRGSVFFVDHEEKCVFAGESLGRDYGLHVLRERCIPEREAMEEEETIRQYHHLRL